MTMRFGGQQTGTGAPRARYFRIAGRANCRQLQQTAPRRQLHVARGHPN
jgi:hypothetical protein